ncbi:YcbK family protein [Futiania mangrovi]|uniref:Murein endopeptidase K n=1 Tax=Futiania mangrovi TaxID=2959716 RepID=A0A9J6PHQ2_9PROT|nr:DUF882 domain-containing protein [Futiania mangrovii]MCP1337344.1 DUF882 domain-containing protein [Futiania mangrovii]
MASDSTPPASPTAGRGPYLDRRRFLRGLAGLTAAAALPVASGGTAEAAMQVRRLRLFNARTGERTDTVYMENGVYVPEALGEIDFLLRDVRTGDIVPVDARIVDLMWHIQRLIDTTEPLGITSGYRSPVTNRRLAGQGAARNSLHMQGMAVDVFSRTRSARQIAGAARRLGRGGVGEYRNRNFVHLDVGPVRTWSRG